MWAYLFYIEYLDETEEENYNYLEYYVNTLVKTINWFPIRRARCLKTTDQDMQKRMDEMHAMLQMYVGDPLQAGATNTGTHALTPSPQTTLLAPSGWWPRSRSAASSAAGKCWRPLATLARALPRQERTPAPAAAPQPRCNIESDQTLFVPSCTHLLYKASFIQTNYREGL